MGKRIEPAWPRGAVPLDEFTARMLEVGDGLYRELPWRHVDDPYAVLVSEIMLQQTQVARVGRFWERFLAAFPTLDARPPPCPMCWNGGRASAITGALWR